MLGTLDTYNIRVLYIWLSSRNVKMLVLQAGAYGVTKYLWVAGAFLIGRPTQSSPTTRSLDIITSDTRVVADCLVVHLPRGPLHTDQQSTLLEREGEVGSCKHTVSTCRAQCDMKSRCWYATADWLPRDGERSSKTLCIDIRLSSTRPWLNPMNRYLIQDAGGHGRLFLCGGARAWDAHSRCQLFDQRNRGMTSAYNVMGR